MAEIEGQYTHGQVISVSPTLAEKYSAAPQFLCVNQSRVGLQQLFPLNKKCLTAMGVGIDYPPLPKQNSQITGLAPMLVPIQTIGNAASIASITFLLYNNFYLCLCPGLSFTTTLLPPAQIQLNNLSIHSLPNNKLKF